ncbi:MAG: chemotaxis protein CheA [Thermoguttaceae bacterium]
MDESQVAADSLLPAAEQTRAAYSAAGHGSDESLRNAFDDLHAMILATDPCDANAVAQLGDRLSGILRNMEPTSREAKLLALGLSGMRNIETLDGAAVLNAVASAVAVSSENLCGPAEQSLDSLEIVAAAIQGLLESEQKQSSPTPPAPSVTDAANASVARGGEGRANAGMGTYGWERELIPAFIVEASDHLTAAESAILLLEVTPDDAESINAALRAFHTIKGSAGLLGVSRIQTLAHQAETFVIQARDGNARISRGGVDLLLQSCDAIKSMVDQLGALPPGEEPLPPSNMETLLQCLSAGMESDDAVDDSPSQPSTTRSLDHADAAPQASSGRCAIRSEKPQTLPVDDIVMRGDATKATTRATPSQPSHASTPVGDTTLRVNIERLDEVVNLVGELVIAQSIVARHASALADDHGNLARSITHAGTIVRQLQGLAMSLRMVPFTGTFHKMSRLVRDLTHQSGKAVAFHTSGEETEIDRNMVQALNDPLMHMIRNALDHGIEPAADRVRCGKSPTGSLHLRAYHAAGAVVVELEDDGRGLDRDKILGQAIRRGLVEAGRDLSDDDVYSLIFCPGLSTADKVTAVSGRGVGMDVVRRNVESLRGHIAVTTQPGAGTTITLRVPLTMAILDAMLLRVGQQQYLLPTIAIQRSFRPDPDSISTVAGRAEMVMLQGTLYPLVRLYKLFDIDGAITDPNQALGIAIEGAGKRCVLMVDEILGQQQAVIKSLGETLADVQGVAGGAILNDGHVGIVLDVVGLMQLVHGQLTGVTPPATAASSSSDPIATAVPGSWS